MKPLALLAALLLLLFGHVARGQHSPIASAHPLQAGMKAPDFSLQDQDGKTRTLQDFTKNGPVAVVFHRSADW